MIDYWIAGIYPRNETLIESTRLYDKTLREQFNKEKESIVKKLATNSRVERYRTVFKFCELYQSWALAKKSQQAEDITRQQSFEICSELPLEITR